MAEAYLKKYLPAHCQVWSAGVEKHGVNPMAIEVMREDGIDISYHTCNLLEDFEHIQFDYVITVCDHANEKCPLFHKRVQRIHKNFTDPAKATGTKDEIIQSFRIVRNEIKEFCRNFASKMSERQPL